MGFQVPIPEGTPFTLANLPFGVISTDENPHPHCAIAIGDFALDLPLYGRHRITSNEEGSLLSVGNKYLIFNEPHLNAFAALPASERSFIRNYLIKALREGSVPESCFVPLSKVKMHLPMKIGGYSDFFCSLEHCQNCSHMTGGTKENFYHAPSVYNGRVSSIIPSSTPVRRPRGVMWDTGGGSGEKPIYGPSKKMDFELEMGYFVSKHVDFGETMSIGDAREHIFGFVLLNDWSSRDIQAFEMPPLGPFHSKGFGTSISPWVVTLDALEPFTCEPKHDHSSTEFEHLHWKDRSRATFNVALKASLVRKGRKHQITSSNLSSLYWTPYQQLTHHASAGCGMLTGDLLGSGTISGDKEGELGCLFEATQDEGKPIELGSGERLGYLEDGDEVVLRDGAGRGRTGLGLGSAGGWYWRRGSEEKRGFADMI